MFQILAKKTSLQNSLSSLLIFLILNHGANAFPGKFGPEWEFTNEAIKSCQKREGHGCNIVDNTESRKLQGRWAKKMEKRCQEFFPKCQVIQEVNKYSNEEVIVPQYKVIYPNIFPEKEEGERDWSYTISLDPGTLEIQATPLTIRDFKRLAPLIQQDVFDMAKSIKLEPNQISGAGHIHLDLVSNFENDPILFRNFFVDFQNHPTLSMGAFNFDRGNAPPLALLSDKARDKFEKIVKDFDAKSNKSAKSVEDFSQKISQEVYQENPYDWEPYEKYHALNVSRLVNPDLKLQDRTLEIRSIRSQRSAQDFIDFLELFEGRIQYLKTLKKEIPYLNFNFDDVLVDPNFLEENPPKYWHKVLDDFYLYVVETGLPWEKYRPMLPPLLQEMKVSTRAIKQGALYTEHFQRECASSIEKWTAPLPLSQEAMIVRVKDLAASVQSHQQSTSRREGLRPRAERSRQSVRYKPY